VLKHIIKYFWKNCSKPSLNKYNHNKKGDSMKDYSGNYSENGFWAVVKEHGKSIPFLRDILAMFHYLMDPETPIWAKGLLTAALGYVILPLDLVPDFIPIAGWADDAGIVSGAMAAVASVIQEKHWKKADKFLNDI
jgi:uncharacterized membrane protein YkvA (DUF1232 family)